VRLLFLTFGGKRRHWRIFLMEPQYLQFTPSCILLQEGQKIVTICSGVAMKIITSVDRRGVRLPCDLDLVKLHVWDSDDTSLDDGTATIRSLFCDLSSTGAHPITRSPENYKLLTLLRSFTMTSTMIPVGYMISTLVIICFASYYRTGTRMKAATCGGSTALLKRWSLLRS
jgi:hypothetical protein